MTDRPTQANRAMTLRRRITEGWLCVLFSALPLGFHNGYFDITEAKAAIFSVLAALLLAVRFILRLAEGGDGVRHPLRLAEAGLLLWAVTVSASSLLQWPLREAVLGASNRYQAAGMAALYAGVFLLLTQEPLKLQWPRRVLLGSFALVSLLALLNMLCSDPLGLLAALRPGDRGRYLSTIGNVNFLAAYAALLLPIAFTELLLAEAWGRRGLYAALTLLGMAALLGGSDAGVLGLLAALSLLPLLLRERPEALRRLPLGAAWLVAAGALLRLFGCPLSAAAGLLFAPRNAPCLIAAAVALWGILRITGETLLRRFVRAYGVWLILAAAGVLCALGYFTVHPECAVSPFAAEYLVMDADWGTDRGAIWAACLRLYRAWPLTQKLFGGGAGCIAAADRAYRLFPDAVVDSAHNEYLHTLLCSGAVGLLGWTACLAGGLRRALCRGSIPLAAGLIAYMAQALVGIAQPITTPLFLTLLALAAGERGASEQRDPAGETCIR